MLEAQLTLDNNYIFLFIIDASKQAVNPKKYSKGDFSHDRP